MEICGGRCYQAPPATCLTTDLAAPAAAGEPLYDHSGLRILLIFWVSACTNGAF